MIHQYKTALSGIFSLVIKMKPLKTKVSITLDMPVLEQTKRLAQTEDRSLSSYINLVLKAHLENQRPVRGK